jgi:undecaprenyl-diphosphatase
MEWFESLFLGVVQGLTEFLPVSSDGHLTITQKAFAWLTGHERSGKENLFFDVMLHVGTLTAIVVYYRAVARTGLKGFLGSESVPPEYRRPAIIRVGVLVAVATLPLVPYALLKKHLESAFESLTVTGLGFLVTAAALLVTARLSGGDKGPERMSWIDALAIGVVQAFAPLPGVSRSGLTVAMALARGLSRSWSVGFSLLIAVPAILGATVFEIKDLDASTLQGGRVAQTIAATIVAGLVGYGAIIWLVKIVRHGRLWYFSVYLIVLGIAVLTAGQLSKGMSDAQRSTALGRSTRIGASGTSTGEGSGLTGRSLDRRVAARPRPMDAGSGSNAPGRARGSSLVLGRSLASDR